MFRIITIAIALLCLVFFQVGADQNQNFAPGFGQSYVNDTIPDRMLPEYPYHVILVFRNTGLVSWDNKLRKVGLLYEGQEEAVTATPSFVEISSDLNITPGKEAAFGLTLLPKGNPGTYNLLFTVVMRSAMGDQKITETFVKKIIIVPVDGISSPETGSVFIESQIPDLEIILDSSYQGKVPSILSDLKPDTYQIQLKNSSSDRKYQVKVEPGIMTSLLITNENDEPVIEKKKARILSGLTLYDIIKANIPVILVITLTIFGGILVIVFFISNKRSEKNTFEQKILLQKKGKDKEPDRAELETNLLEKIHRHHPILEGPSSSPVSPRMRGKTIYSREPKIEKKPDSKKVKGISKDKTLQNAQNLSGVLNTPLEKVDLNIQNLQLKPGSATASIGVFNRSGKAVQVQDVPFGAGGTGIVPVDLNEPEDDSHEYVLPLRILYSGSEYIKKLVVPYNRGIAFFSRGMSGKALEYFRSLLSSNPGVIDAMYDQSVVLIRWGLKDEANMILEEIIRQDPHNDKALKALESIKSRNHKELLESASELDSVILGYPDELSERYTPIRLLGDDKYAKVILVRKNDTGDLRALKLPNVSHRISSSVLTEISLLYQLRHPYVLRMYRAEFKPVIFLEMEYAAGSMYDGKERVNLYDLPVPLPRVDWHPLIEKVAEGLSYLHKQGVRHYHLSPRNILLNEPMIPKISGFLPDSVWGYVDHKKEDYFTLAPEQIDPVFFGNTGKRTDLYQLGAIWLWLATGKILNQELSKKDDKDLRGYLGRYDPEFAGYDPMMQKLIARFKKDRYSSAEEFLSEIKKLWSL